MIWVKSESIAAVLAALKALGRDGRYSEATIVDYTELPQPEVRAALHSIAITGLRGQSGDDAEGLDRGVEAFLKPYRYLPFPFI